MNWKGLFLGVASAPVLVWIPKGCAKEQLHCMLDRIPAYKCFLLLFCTLSPGCVWVWSHPTPPPIPSLQPLLQRTWLFPTCSLWMLRKHPAK